VVHWGRVGGLAAWHRGIHHIFIWQVIPDQHQCRFVWVKLASSAPLADAPWRLVSLQHTSPPWSVPASLAHGSPRGTWGWWCEAASRAVLGGGCNARAGGALLCCCRGAQLCALIQVGERVCVCKTVGTLVTRNDGRARCTPQPTATCMLRQTRTFLPNSAEPLSPQPKLHSPAHTAHRHTPRGPSNNTCSCARRGITPPAAKCSVAQTPTPPCNC
jgi:hypothetical protein